MGNATLPPEVKDALAVQDKREQIMRDFLLNDPELDAACVALDSDNPEELTDALILSADTAFRYASELMDDVRQLLREGKANKASILLHRLVSGLEDKNEELSLMTAGASARSAAQSGDIFSVVLNIAKIGALISDKQKRLDEEHPMPKLPGVNPEQE